MSDLLDRAYAMGHDLTADPQQVEVARALILDLWDALTTNKTVITQQARDKGDLELMLHHAKRRIAFVEAELRSAIGNGGEDDRSVSELSIVWIGGDQGDAWQDEFAKWYEPAQWPLGVHRAANAFLSQKVVGFLKESSDLKAVLTKALALIDDGDSPALGHLKTDSLVDRSYYGLACILGEARPLTEKKA